MQTEKYLTSPRALVNVHMRHAQNGHKGGVFWLTGLSSSGKSTLAHAVEKKLFDQKMQINVLDGDVIRTGLCADLSFSEEGRAENIRRIAEMSKVFALQGFICLCAFISPLRAHRAIARRVLQEHFHEIYISCPIEECEKRDVKGYYALARAGKIKNYTGISAAYDIPAQPDLVVETNLSTQDECIQKIQDYILKKVQL